MDIKKKLENEISFFRLIVQNSNLISSNYFRMQRFLILYNKVFENYINQICCEILTHEEQASINFQEFKNTFKNRLLNNFELFSSPQSLLESCVRDLLLRIWKMVEKTKSIQQKNSLGFLKTKISELCSLEHQIFNLSECLSLNNISEIESQLEIIIKEYNLYLLQAMELIYVRRQVVLLLINLRKYPQAQFLFFNYILSFDSQIFQDFTYLNSIWVDICGLSGRILSLKTFQEIKNTSNVFISKLNKLLSDFD